MTYTATDVRRVIENYDASGEEAKFLRLFLLNTEAVKFGALGHAFFVQEEDERRGYDYEGDIHYVFKIQSPDGSERFFMIDGYYSSYAGATYYLNDRSPREVKPAEQVRYIWENA